MIRTPFKVGSIEVAANGNKQLAIPVNLGTVTGITFRMMNGSAPVADIAVTKAVLKSIRLEASPKNGMSFDIIKPLSAAQLYLLWLFTDEEHRAYLNIDTADLAALTLTDGSFQHQAIHIPVPADMTLDYVTIVANSNKEFQAYYRRANMSDFKVIPNFNATGAAETQIEVWYERFPGGNDVYTLH